MIRIHVSKVPRFLLRFVAWETKFVHRQMRNKKWRWLTLYCWLVPFDWRIETDEDAVAWGIVSSLAKGA